MTRLFTSTGAKSIVPKTDEQCAAYCLLVNPDCMLYHFDEVAAKCYAGMISSTSGSFEGEAAGNKNVKFVKGTYLGRVFSMIGS